eukprot:m.90716 g.90716  ORF g.90716 m.90716 type:complete len:367 (-) comp12310_c0_seq4:197-1297(-)
MTVLEEVESLECIGKGSFATVHKCKLFSQKEATLAVKVLDLEKCDDLMTIMREVTVMKLCQHVNLTALFEVQLRKQKVWLVMELSTLGAVSALLKQMGGMTEAAAGVVLHGTLHGLDYLHAHGWTHCDIKTNNILVHGNGTVKLCDFGVAVQTGEKGYLHKHEFKKNTPKKEDLDEATNTQSLDLVVMDTMDVLKWMKPITKYNEALLRRPEAVFAGTAYYMAPEIIKQEIISTKSDIWSTGIVAIELLDGVVPYAKVHPLTAMKMIVQHPPPKPSKAKKLSKHYLSLLSALLEKDPFERASAASLFKNKIVSGGKKCKPLVAFAKNFTFKPDVTELDGDDDDDDEEDDIKHKIQMEQLKNFWDFD